MLIRQCPPMRQARSNRPGQSMVEFALVMPLLLVLLFGIIEFGRLLLFYSSVVSASREGARYGSAAGDVGDSTAHYEDCAGIRAAARRVGFFAGISDADIHISYDTGSASAPTSYRYICSDDPLTGIIDPTELGDRITVVVSATFEPVLGLIPIEPITLSSETSRTFLKDVEILITDEP